MAYKIEFKPAALRSFSSLPKPIKKQIAKKIDVLANNPRPPGVKKLSGSESRYRIRSGEYRVVYEIRDNLLLILVVRIGHRREVYRD